MRIVKDEKGRCIRNCLNCANFKKHYYGFAVEYSCHIKDDKKIDNMYIVQDWCPLPDYKEDK
jgi:hypothetical protein